MALPSLVDPVSIQAELDALRADLLAAQSARDAATRRLGGLRGALSLAQQRGAHDSIPRILAEMAAVQAEYEAHAAQANRLHEHIRRRKAAIASLATQKRRMSAPPELAERNALTASIGGIARQLRAAELHRDRARAAELERKLAAVRQRRDDLTWQLRHPIDAPIAHQADCRTTSALDCAAQRCQRAPVMVTPGVCPKCGSRMVHRDDDGNCCWHCGWRDWATARPGLAAWHPLAEADARLTGIAS